MAFFEAIPKILSTPASARGGNLRPLDNIPISDTVPWRDLFPEYADEEMPGVCLAGSRRKENMTQKQLSELTGIPQSHISEMENGKDTGKGFECQLQGISLKIRALIACLTKLIRRQI